MGENKIDRRDVCKTLLAFGGLTLGGLVAKGQTPTPTPLDDILQDQRIADAVKRGATMEEIAELRDPLSPQSDRSPACVKGGKRPFFRRTGAPSRSFPPPNAARRF